MNIYSYTDEAKRLLPLGSFARYEGRSLDEFESVRILWSIDIKFSKNKGRARRESPVPYLNRGMDVPSNLRFVVLTKHARPGNKAWGRIDFLVRFCGYELVDERD